MMFNTINKNKRNLLIGLSATAGGIIVPVNALTKVLNLSKERKVALKNIHTNEDIEVSYWKDGVYLEREVMKINELLRDHRSEQVASMDVNIIDQVFAVQKKLGCYEQISIISGFRSKTSNEELRQRSRGVAKKSYHTLGRAIDINVPGVPLQKQRVAAIKLYSGGVGYYGKSRFIHIDSGPVRFW